MCRRKCACVVGAVAGEAVGVCSVVGRWRSRRGAAQAAEVRVAWRQGGVTVRARHSCRQFALCGICGVGNPQPPTAAQAVPTQNVGRKGVMAHQAVSRSGTRPNVYIQAARRSHI